MIPLPNVRIKLLTNSEGVKSHSPSKDSSNRRRSSTIDDSLRTSDLSASRGFYFNIDPSRSNSPGPVIGDQSPHAGQYLKSCFPAKPRQCSLSVTFTKVEFREYPIILVENPCTSSGPPIGLDWMYDPEDTTESDIDSYETFRDMDDCRRSKSDLRIPANVRVQILTNAGYSPSQLRMAAKTLKEGKERMHASIRNRKYDAINERAELFKNKFKRMSGVRRASVVSSVEPSSIGRTTPRRASTGSSVKPLGIKRDSLCIP